MAAGLDVFGVLFELILVSLDVVLVQTDRTIAVVFFVSLWERVYVSGHKFDLRPGEWTLALILGFAGHVVGVVLLGHSTEWFSSERKNASR